MEASPERRRSRRRSRRRLGIVATIALLVGMLAVLAPAEAAQAPKADQNADSPYTGPTVDTSSALVQLKGDPLSTYVKTKPPQGKKIDFSSTTVKSYRAQLSALRNDFKQWLQANAPKAKITGSWDISLNAVSVQLNGTKLSTLAAAPQAKRVEYQGVYHPTANDPDLDIIHAQEAWNVGGGSASAGAGVKVAIIDSGIDISHPCFADAGYPSQTQLGDRNFTNNKVVVAKVFNNKATSKGYTAQAIHDHGTHVAGTVACNFGTPANVNGVAIPHTISGVAPRALLGNYNVFPGDMLDARSEDILNALDAAYADGMDVANMSLGGGAHGIQDLLTIAVDDLDQANMVVAVSAGNSGPGHYTIESPGSAARALTAGSSTVGHLVAAPITVDGITAAAVAGDFSTVSADLTATLSVVTEAPLNPTTGLSTACGPLVTPLTGSIALISRGTCSFSTKIRNAQYAGAAAVLVANNLAGDGISMAQDGTSNQPTVPAYSVGRNDGSALMAHAGVPTTIGATASYLVTGNDDFMSGSSSQGPTDVDFRVKPDVVAPGVNVLSSVPAAFCSAPPCFSFKQGTSMAAPHLAGSAAVVKGLHPGWSAAQIRSAIVNTADQGVLQTSSSGGVESDVNIIGAGRENLFAAVNAAVAIDPVSVSFGAVPSGSGQSATRLVTLTNLGTGASTLSISVWGGDPSVAYSVSPAQITLSPGGSGTLTVSMTSVKGAGVGDHAATLTIGAGGSVIAHAVVYTITT